MSAFQERRALFFEPPFDRSRYLLFPASWPFLDEFGCVLWIDAGWRVLGASEVRFLFRGFEFPHGRTESLPYAETPRGPLEIEHAHVMVPDRALYRTVLFRYRLPPGLAVNLWFDDNGLPPLTREIAP